MYPYKKGGDQLQCYWSNEFVFHTHTAADKSLKCLERASITLGYNYILRNRILQVDVCIGRRVKTY